MKNIVIWWGIFIALLVAGYVLLWQKKSIVAPDISVPTEKNTLQVVDVATIFALGDSLTAGYQLPLEQSYPAQLETILAEKGYAYTVINGGKSGDTSAWLLARIAWLTADAVPGDIALIVIWANDGMQSLPLAQLEENISQTIESLQEKQIQVILGWMQIPTNLSPEYRSSFAEIYPRIAEQYSIPLIPFFLEWVAADPNLNLPDGIHPNQTWYTIIAAQTAAFLLEQWILEKQ